MAATKRLLVVIPAYNEQDSLPSVIADLRAYCPWANIVVVNDGSADNTSRIARSLGASVLDLPYNLGIGGAVQTGLLFAAERGYDIAVQFDGDGQHRADQIPLLLAALEDPGCDVALGSRFLKPSSYRVPLGRRCGIAIFRFVNSLVLRKRITDNTSGFRAYNRRALTFLAREYPHDYPEPESVVTLSRHGFRVVEVPVSMRMRQGGHSSITFLRSIYYMFKVLLAIGIGATRRTVREARDESPHPDCLSPR